MVKGSNLLYSRVEELDVVSPDTVHRDTDVLHSVEGRAGVEHQAGISPPRVQEGRRRDVALSSVLETDNEEEEEIIIIIIVVIVVVVVIMIVVVVVVVTIIIIVVVVIIITIFVIIVIIIVIMIVFTKSPLSSSS